MDHAPSDQDLSALSQDVARLLSERRLQLAAAESCTGGWLAKLCTDIAGSSTWFERGVVVYSNQAKQELLGVRPSSLARHGAVSEVVALELVDGLLQRSPADLAVAITGIAGPGGGSAEKPVGTVWIALGARGMSASARQFRFTGERDAVRRQALAQALQWITRYSGRGETSVG